jgi:uncharacterized phosphosugar-binding protein
VQSLAYGNQMIERLSWIVAEQVEPINAAALVVADSIGEGHRVWIAETTHCLHDEVTYRAGGLMAVHKLGDPIAIERGDVVVIGTNAGTNAITVDLALISRERGAPSIALTQLPYEMDPRLVPEHSSGKRLSEVADIVIDLGNSGIGCHASTGNVDDLLSRHRAALRARNPTAHLGQYADARCPRREPGPLRRVPRLADRVFFRRIETQGTSSFPSARAIP